MEELNMADMTPIEAIRILKEGNKRFLTGRSNHASNLQEQVQETAEGQYPFAAILGCIDSRAPAEMIFDVGIGDILNVRVAGNIVNDDVLGSLEFACAVLKAKVILVMGHTQCGAVESACNNVELGNITGMLKKIKPAIDAEKLILENRTGSNKEFVNSVSKQHVWISVENIRKSSTVIADLEKEGKVRLEAAMYDVASGRVTFLSP